MSEYDGAFVGWTVAGSLISYTTMGKMKRRRFDYISYKLQAQLNVSRLFRDDGESRSLKLPGILI